MTEPIYITDWKDLQGKKIRNIKVQEYYGGGYEYIFLTLSHNRRVAIGIKIHRDYYDGDDYSMKLVEEKDLELFHIVKAGWITEEEKNERWNAGLQARSEAKEKKERAEYNRLKRRFENE